jgi:energy-converting hydrogenase Eha subunit H
MKIFSYTLIALATGLIIFNATKLNFSNLLEGESTVAVICILAALCVILLLLILRTSKQIEQKKRK